VLVNNASAFALLGFGDDFVIGHAAIDHHRSITAGTPGRARARSKSDGITTEAKFGILLMPKIVDADAPLDRGWANRKNAL
jgi:hypothetical protein